MANTMIIGKGSAAETNVMSKAALELEQKIHAAANQSVTPPNGPWTTAAAMQQAKLAMSRSIESKQQIVVRVESIDNGYLVTLATGEGAIASRYYAEDLKAVGERITAYAVSQQLGEDSET